METKVEPHRLNRITMIKIVLLSSLLIIAEASICVAGPYGGLQPTQHTTAQPTEISKAASAQADRINALVALHQATRERRWLDGAREAGDYAVRAFVHPSGLIRGTAIVDRPDYYDAIQGPGALALALYRLGAADVAD